MFFTSISTHGPLTEIDQFSISDFFKLREKHSRSLKWYRLLNNQTQLMLTTVR